MVAFDWQALGSKFIVGGGVVMVFILLIGFVVLLWFLKKQAARFVYNIVIWKYDGVNKRWYKKYGEKGAILYKKKEQMKFLWLKNNKVGLQCDDIPVIFTEHGKKHIMEVNVIQKGLKNFAYMRQDITSQDNFTISVGEEDLNWAQFELQRMKNIFDITPAWTTWAAYGIFIFAVMAILIITYMLFQKFEVLKDVSTNLLEVSKQLAMARQGTTVLPG